MNVLTSSCLRLTLLFFLLPLLTDAQSKVHTIDISDGLSQGMIFDIAEDFDGYLWFATFNGVNRYNGYDIQVFGHEPFVPHQLHTSATSALHVDVKGGLWIGTENDGLHIRHRQTGRITAVHMADHADHTYVSKILEDKEGNIWFTTQQQAIYRVKTGHITDWSHAEGQLIADKMYQAPRISTANVVLSCDAAHRVYLSPTTGVLLRYSDSRGAFVPEEVVPEGHRYVDFGSDGNLWMTTREHIVVHTPERIHRLPIPVMVKDTSLQVFFDHTHNIAWVTFKSHHELYYIDFNASQPEIRVYLTLPTHIHITKLFVAKNKLWIGTNGYGVRYIDLSTSPFSHLAPNHSIKWIGELSPHNIVFAGYENVTCADCDTAGQRQLATLQAAQPHLRLIFPARCHSGFWALYGDVGRQYQGKTGVLLLDASGSILRRWPCQDIDVYYGAAVEDAKGCLWVGGDQGVFVKFDKELRQPQRYAFDTLHKGTIPYKQSYHLYFGARGDLWKSTPNGLERLTFSDADASPQYIRYTYNDQNADGLSNRKVFAVIDDHQAPEQFLWVATSGGGLNHLNKETGQSTFISNKDGLPDNVIYGLIYNDGLLWMSTNRGLVAYNPLTKGIQHYTAADGLQHNEFNTGAFYRSPYSGQFYFGGVNGITAFSSAAFRRKPTPMVIQLEALRINNTLVRPHLANSASLSTHINYLDELRLKWSQNKIEIAFAALTFTDNNTQYRFKLSPLQHDWVYTQGQRTAHFNSLRPGRYTFSVESTNAQGEWSNNVRTLQLYIAPPWWASSWAYLAYTIITLVLLYLLTNSYPLRIINRHDASLKDQALRQLQALDQLKNTFFSNIPHELRTPLQQGIDQQPDAQQSMQMAYQSGQIQLYQVNELLDLAKLNHGEITPQYRTEDLNAFFDHTISSYGSLCQVFNVRFHPDVQLPPDCHATIAPRLWEKVLHNVISNAFKFTASDGEITLKVRLHTPDTLQVIVRDNGIGISPQQLKHIFDRHYRTEEAQVHAPSGTRIGLPYTKAIIDALNGHIDIQSPSQVGTTVTLLLPLAATVSTAIASTLPPAPAQSHDRRALSQDCQILIVEDHPDIAQYLSDALTEAGYLVSTTADGRQGLAHAVEHLPDIILSDVMMPHIDGQSMTAALKNNLTTAHIPVVLLTSKDSPQSHLQGLTDGADYCLTKPIHVALLLQQFQNIMTLRAEFHRVLRAQVAITPSVTTEALPSLDDRFLLLLKTTINAHLMEADFGVDSLAEQLQMSRSQLYRKINALLGITPAQLIREIKMHYAKQQLETQQLTVSEIAYQLGYANPKYFSTIFKQVHGSLPKDVLNSTAHGSNNEASNISQMS